ncbi:MAG TPA: DAHL domain-containing protein [Polyangiaceae bacterium]
MTQLVKRLGTGAAILVGLAIAAGLYTKTQPKTLETHAAIVDLFGTLHTLDATISQQALAARHGLTPHYDALTQSVLEFQINLDALDQELAVRAQGTAELAPALTALRVDADERSNAVERFKMQNSILKNSLYYLPLAGQQVIDDVEGAPERSPAAPVIGAAVSNLVQMTLAQNLLGGQAERENVERQVERLQRLSPDVPEAARERYELLLAHANTASRLQQVVDPIVRDEVMGTPVAKNLSHLERLYTDQFHAAIEEAGWYRSVLYGWSMLLLAALLAAAVKLRSVYANLERLVRERTQKLDEALKELWGEMELAKKIQTALVPQRFALKDCEVAAVMRPADQVGGDYYDVFDVGGVEWVLIGDVSGHGVPAGLIMMMCQTSVRSVLAANPNIGPDELLALVNRTLTQNIERLGEDKYMTISALKREPNGSFKVAGMHQDLLIYRAKSGRVDQLLAQGTWLGITTDIRELNPVRSVELEPGDALVLYTDGITEARRQGEMLDVEGLKQAVLAHGREGAEAILGGILSTLADYEIHDDVAAVIIKQREPTRSVEESAA